MKLKDIDIYTISYVLLYMFSDFDYKNHYLNKMI